MPQNSTRRSTKQISGEDIVVETAWLYYHDGLNQSEIANKLLVSRATVVNYLQEARERGYIHTKLSPEAFNTHRAALDLRERFGLKAAYVLPDGTGGPRKPYHPRGRRLAAKPSRARRQARRGLGQDHL